MGYYTQHKQFCQGLYGVRKVKFTYCAYAKDVL
jgi:hypothetical protein